MGGFDETYCRPSIEDIELGYRMAKAGYRIDLIKSLQVKHLKRWDAISLLRADFSDRALPWTRLILNQGKIPNDLNLKTGARISVILIFLIVINFFTLFLIPFASLASLLSMAGLILLNSDLYRFFYFRKGLKFTFMAVLCHWLYFFYSGLAFLFGLMGYTVNKIKRRKMFNQRGIGQ
jgi:GT2 family glycosyltransferase